MLLLRICTFLLLVGKAWQFFRWETPFSVIPFSDFSLTLMEYSCGVLCVLAAILVAGGVQWVPKKVARVFIYAASLALLLHSLGSFAASGWQFPQLIEHSIQWSLPLLWWGFWAGANPVVEKGSWYALLAISLTFAGHGLFAAGVWPVPTHFVGMTQAILGLSTTGALWFLLLAGVLDLILAVFIFYPKFRNYLLLYAAFWGTLTALARIVAHLEWDALAPSLDRWAFETAVRLGHGGLPAFIWWFQKKT